MVYIRIPWSNEEGGKCLRGEGFIKDKAKIWKEHMEKISDEVGHEKQGFIRSNGLGSHELV